MKILNRILFLTSIAIPALAVAENRWYDQSTVNRGAPLFQQNCAACHGINAEATADWKKTDANGNYPPPPLNGSAHAWHHSKQLLKKTIREGGAKLGGLMPPFEGRFSDKELDALVAYFQSKWPDDVYHKWADRFVAGESDPATQTVTTSPAEQSTDASAMTNLLRLRLGNQPVSRPTKTPLEGLYETQFGNQYGYLSEDGRYVLIGNLIDLKTGENLTKLAKGKTAIAELNRISVDDKVIFPARGEEKAVLNVFTDTSCPYCKKLHEEVGKLQDAGISVHYLPYPRGGSQGPGYRSLKQVWCASNKQEAMSIAKEIDIGDLPPGDCERGNFVDQGYALGNRVGVTGTPSLFKSNGENIVGYVPYRELIPQVLNN